MKTATCAISDSHGPFPAGPCRVLPGDAPSPEPETFPTGLSTCWRKNTSRLEAAELANLLRALRKVAGHLGDPSGRIEYAGMSTACGHGIRIEMEPLMGHYPVPAEKVDYLVGIVVHEVLRRREWSDHVWKLLEPFMDALTPRSRVVFQKIVHTGEKIYLDLRANRNVFGLYTRISRNRSIREDQARFDRFGPSLDALMIRWWENAFPPQEVSDISRKEEFSLETLAELESLTQSLKVVSGSRENITSRCENRAALYQEAWQNLGPGMAPLRMIDKHLFWYSYAGDGGKTGKSGAAHRAKNIPKPPPDLLQDIERHLSCDAVDITPLIRAVAGYDDESVAPMSRWDFQTESHPVVDRKMIGRLKSVFSRFADHQFLMNRGLQSGRIDRRRLYRAGVDGRCFKTVDRIPNPDWSVGLLVDASGSMRGNKWRMVENTIATIHKALSGYRNRLSAWAYFEVTGICMISRLISGNRLYSVPPAGQTASGQAIIAAAGMMPEKNKKKIIIHVTDGESNFGCDVSCGIAFCREKNIHLVTLGCGYKNRQVMEEQYNHAIQFVDHFEQLPRAVERLLKWTFLYGSRQSHHRIPFKTANEKGVQYAQS